MELVLADIALQQDQPAVSRNAQLFSRNHREQLPNLVGDLFGGFGDGAFDIDDTCPEHHVFGDGVLFQ